MFSGLMSPLERFHEATCGETLILPEGLPGLWFSSYALTRQPNILMSLTSLLLTPGEEVPDPLLHSRLLTAVASVWLNLFSFWFGFLLPGIQKLLWLHLHGEVSSKIGSFSSSEQLSVFQLAHLSVPIRQETRVHVWIFTQLLLLHWTFYENKSFDLLEGQTQSFFLIGIQCLKCFST